MQKYKKGRKIKHADNKNLYLIKSGQVSCMIGSDIIETLIPGDFFGEETALFSKVQTYDVKAMDDVELFKIPVDEVRDIPIVRWKLLEKSEKRRCSILNPNINNSTTLMWRVAYRIGVKDVDDRHQALFALGSEYLKSVTDEPTNGKRQTAAFKKFLKELGACFKAEERLCKKHDAPDSAKHQKRHQYILGGFQDLLDLVDSQPTSVADQFARLFQGRLVKHFLMEDHQLGVFLNSREVF